MTTELKNNPLLCGGEHIQFNQIRPEHIPPAIRELIRDGEKEIAQIVALEGPRSFENTVMAIDRLGFRLNEAWKIVKTLLETVSSPELENAIKEVDGERSRFVSGIRLSQGLWRALKDYSAKKEAAGLDAVDRRALERLIDQCKLAGADLDEASRSKLLEIDEKLAALEICFKGNLNKASEQVQIILDRAPQGLPGITLQTAAASAVKEGSPGKFYFGADESSYDSIMRFAEDPALRRRMFVAFQSRALGGEFDNISIAAEELALRREKAEILRHTGIAGLESFADFQLALRMARSGSAAVAMMQRIADKARPAFERETEELLTFKREIEADPAVELDPWDIAYYSEKLRARRHGFNENEVMEYLPLKKALAGLFRVAEDLYGLRIQASSTMPVWHPEVEAFEVFEADGKWLGSFYMDLYAREGSKSQGAWMETLRMRLPGMSGHDRHTGMLACNFSKPDGDTPTLLKLGELETLFHEFGHLLHALFIRSPHVCFSEMPWDAVELPSQLMENWVWDEKVLRSLSAHYQRTDEPIPHELFEKMLAARNFRQASSSIVRLTGYSLLDLSLHMEYRPEIHGDLLEYSQKFLADFTPGRVEPCQTRINRFQHLFSGEYAAAYYSYMWALVLACDAFGRFRQEGLANRQTGEDFRKTVLSRGDTVDIMQAYNEFMLRDPGAAPDIEALFRVYGINGGGI